MFEDGPPPLPSALSHTEGSPDGGLADLDDDNRLTAVADDDDPESVQQPDPSSVMGIPDFEPDRFVEVPRSNAKDGPEGLIPSERRDSDRNAGDSQRETRAESPSRPVVNHVEAVPQESMKIDASDPERPDDLRDDEMRQKDVGLLEDGTSDDLQPSSCHQKETPPMGSESDAIQPEKRPSESEGPLDVTSESVQESEVPSDSGNLETRMSECSMKDKQESTSSLKPLSVDKNNKEETCEPPSVSGEFLEATDDTTTAVGGTFEQRASDDQEAAAPDEDDDDDFGDFEEFGDFAETKPVQKEEGEDSGGWAAFETAPSGSNEVGQGEQDEWAADFNSAPAPQSHLQAPTPGVAQHFDGAQLCPLCDILDGDSLWSEDNLDWEGSEDKRECDEEEQRDGIVEDLDRTKPKLDNLKEWQSLWLSVSIVEEALALKMQWTHSAFYSSFLESLHLDANLAAIRNSNLPAFAQQLGGSAAILQPVTSVDSTPQVNKSESAPRISSLCQSPTDSSTPSLPLKELIEPKGSTHSIKEHRPRSVPVDSLAVPPAQFDWGNSGLTNPLTAGSISASSALLDLDFLTANESKIVTIAGRSSTTADISAALQKDLAALGLNTTTTDAHSVANGSSNTEQKTNILEELMRKEKRQHKYTPPSELSLDARALHDQLPDLDYMLSNVLLFPMTDR